MVIPSFFFLKKKKKCFMKFEVLVKNEFLAYFLHNEEPLFQTIQTISVAIISQGAEEIIFIYYNKI